MPGARLGHAGLGPQRAAGQRRTRPIAGWPIWEQGCVQIVLAFHWVWDKDLRVYIQQVKHLAGHLSCLSSMRGNERI